jgi:hypothetical protein
MKALSRAAALLCLISTSAIAQESDPFAVPAKPKAAELKCIKTIETIHEELKVKGAILLTQMMNQEIFVRVYTGRLDTNKEQRYVLLVMAIRTDESPNGVTRVACTRETDGAQFHLLRLAYPITDEEA